MTHRHHTRLAPILALLLIPACIFASEDAPPAAPLEPDVADTAPDAPHDPEPDASPDLEEMTPDPVDPVDPPNPNDPPPLEGECDAQRPCNPQPQAEAACIDNLCVYTCQDGFSSQDELPEVAGCSCEIGAEVCDGQDDDCDGVPDNGLEPLLCERQQGVCAGAEVACAGDVDAYSTACAPAIYAAHSAQFTAEGDERWLCDGVDNDCDGSADEACCLNGDLAARISAGTRHTLNLATEGRIVAIAPALASGLPGHAYTAVSAGNNQAPMRLLDAQGGRLASPHNLFIDNSEYYKQLRLLPVEDGHLLLALTVPQTLKSQPRHKQYGRVRQWHISPDGQTRRVEQELWDANIIDFDADIVDDRVAIAALRRTSSTYTSAIICQQQRAPMQALSPCDNAQTQSLDTTIQAGSPINVKLGPSPGQTAVAWANLGYRIWEGAGQPFRYEEASIEFYLRNNPLNPTPKIALAWFNGRLLALTSIYVPPTSHDPDYQDTEALWLLVPSLDRTLPMSNPEDVNPSGHTDHQPSMVADEEGILMTWSAPGRRVMARVDRSLLTDASLNTQEALIPTQVVLSDTHDPFTTQLVQHDYRRLIIWTRELGGQVNPVTLATNRFGEPICSP